MIAPGQLRANRGKPTIPVLCEEGEIVDPELLENESSSNSIQLQLQRFNAPRYRLADAVSNGSCENIPK